jgi:hypothetical protein
MLEIAYLVHELQEIQNFLGEACPQAPDVSET